MIDQRFEQLTNWITTKVGQDFAIDLLESDASFRRYFRLKNYNLNLPFSSLVIMDAPPEYENCKSYLEVEKILATAHVNVPKIYYQDFSNGFLAISDFGDFSYHDYLNTHPNIAGKLYKLAFDSLIKIQLLVDANKLPSYDRQKMMNELMLFPNWFLKKHLNIEFAENELIQLFSNLIDRYQANPRVLVHRDYHIRNLMVLEENQKINEELTPGILDFQDAVYGPITYDLVSILRDAYLEWEEDIILDWLIRYWERAKKAGLPVNLDFAVFYQDFDYMILLRHIKVLGIFSRLNFRDHKPQYLEYLPLVFRYCRTIANRYRDLKYLANLFEQIEDKVLAEEDLTKQVYSF